MRNKLLIFFQLLVCFFSVTSFGFSEQSSNYLPSESNSFLLEVIDTLAPEPTWTLRCDGSVNDGKVTDMPIDISVRSNLSTIELLSDLSFNYLLKYDAIVPGITKTTQWFLKVLDSLKDARAVISFKDKRGNEKKIQIDHHLSKITIRPSNVDFGLFKSGDILRLNFWAINESQSVDTIFDIRLKDGFNGFSEYPSYGEPYVIQANDSVKFSIRFLASQSGYYEDSVGWGNRCDDYYKAKVFAKVEDPFIFASDVWFDTTTVGKVGFKDFYIKNEGLVPLVITGYRGPNQRICTTNLPLIADYEPLILQAQEIKTFEIKYKPVAVGKLQDSIIFISDAGTNYKNVCRIIGTSISTGLNSYDFEIESTKIISISPNPATDFIEISYSPSIKRGQGGVSVNGVRIFNIFGEEISTPSLLRNATPQEGNLRIDVSSLSPGVYFVRVGEKVGKFVKI